MSRRFSSSLDRRIFSVLELRPSVITGGCSSRSSTSAISARLRRSTSSSCSLRTAAQSVGTTIFQDESDRFRQVLSTFFHRFALSIRAGNLRTISDEPLSVPFHDSGEFVVHSPDYSPVSYALICMLFTALN